LYYNLKTLSNWSGVPATRDIVELFDNIANLLALRPGVSRSKMFGMPVVKVNGKAFIGLSQDKMVFKLAEAERIKALKLSGAHLFEPMEGRAMKEWVEVPVRQASEGTLHQLAEAALIYVRSLTEITK
jgi:hypothetical protein